MKYWISAKPNYRQLAVACAACIATLGASMTALASEQPIFFSSDRSPAQADSLIEGSAISMDVDPDSTDTDTSDSDDDECTVAQHVDADTSRSAVARAAADTQRAAADAARAVSDARLKAKDAARVASDAAKAAAASVDVSEIRETVRRAMEEASRGGVVYQMSGETPERGNPYSAREVREFKQTLADGTVISRQSTRLLARDSEGRTRQELRQPDGSARIFINDPVAKEAIIIDPQKRFACRAPFHKDAIYDCFSQLSADWKTLGFKFNASSTGGLGIMTAKDDVVFNVSPGAKIVDLTQSSDATRWNKPWSNSGAPVAPPVPPVPPVAPVPPVPPVAPSNDGNIKRERSTQTYEGLRVYVERSVETIAAGAIGNSRAIESINERFYSPDLKMNVFSRRSDPRSGDAIYRMVDVKRSEPDISQFRVPAGLNESQGKR
jgi:hypothetical protein